VLEIEISGRIRLSGTESHSVVNTLALVTYICPTCETHRVEMVGADFTRDQSANCRQASAGSGEE